MKDLYFKNKNKEDCQIISEPISSKDDRGSDVIKVVAKKLESNLVFVIRVDEIGKIIELMDLNINKGLPI